MNWGYGDPEHPQAQYIFGETMCACALMYITQKSKSHWKMFYSQKGKKGYPVKKKYSVFLLW